MNQPQRKNLDVPEYDPDSDVQFSQPPQILAIVTLILGPLCFVALFKTTFWIFPILTVALGTASIFSLARNPEKIGRKAALIGIAFAIFFGTWATSHYFSRQQWLLGHARRNADIWFKLVQENKLFEAYQLHRPQEPHEDEDEGESMDDSYAKEEAEAEYSGFFKDNPLAKFVKVRTQATVDFVRLEAYLPRGSGVDLVLHYVARYMEDGEQQELEMRLLMRRHIDSMAGECEWTVYRVMGITEPL